MKLKKITSIVLSAAMAAGLWTAAPAAWAAEPAAAGYTVTKISNPDRGEREEDGLVKGGDRGNSCVWQLVRRGEDIYIAADGNIAGALINMFAPTFARAGLTEDMIWAMLAAVANGNIPRSDEGASILSYNRGTGEFKVVYTAGVGDSFRMAVNFGDDIYFGTSSIIPGNPQYILKLDRDGNFTKVFETAGSVSLRAACVYDGQLFIGGADDRETVPEGTEKVPTKMAILKKSAEDDAKWDRVADYTDFGETPYDAITAVWPCAPILEMTSHNGWLYATAPGRNGFAMFRGRPAAEGETANAYGWVWEEVVGPTNGINNPGLFEAAGGEADPAGSQLGSVFEYKGDLYAYNSDQAFIDEEKISALLAQIKEDAEVRPSEVLSDLYNLLRNPQKLWKLDDASGKFAECGNLTKLTQDTTNEYIWRVGEYDGQMYISTMDANFFYNCLTPLSGMSFIDLTQEEVAQRIDYIDKLIDALQSSGLQEMLGIDSLNEILEKCRTALEQLRKLEINEETVGKYLESYRMLREELDKAVERVRKGIDEKDLENLVDQLLSTDQADKLLDSALTRGAVLLDGVDIKSLIPESLESEMTDKIVAMLQIFATTSRTYNKLGKTAKKLARIAMIAELKKTFKSLLKDNYSEIEAILGKIDWEGLDMYQDIAERIRENEAGFDLFRTSDGENFEVITRNGFGDRFNFGCPGLLSTEEGLYLGTCNPLYGSRLYLLANTPEAEEVTLNVSSKKLLVGNSFQLTAEVLPEGADAAVTWKSGNPDVAAVTKNGKVTVVAAGETTVTATTANGLRAVCKVTGTAKKVYQCAKGGTVIYTTSLSKAKSLKAKGYAAKRAFYAPGTSGTKVYYVHAAKSGHYRYTTSRSFALQKKKSGCTVGLAFYAAYENGTPVYELVKNGVYRYTVSKSEAKSLKSDGYTYKGIAWQAEKV